MFSYLARMKQNIVGNKLNEIQKPKENIEQPKSCHKENIINFIKAYNFYGVNKRNADLSSKILLMAIIKEFEENYQTELQGTDIMKKFNNMQITFFINSLIHNYDSKNPKKMII